MLGFSPLGKAPLAGSVGLLRAIPPASRTAELANTGSRQAKLADTGTRFVSIA